jgi:hypothetical protein
MSSPDVDPGTTTTTALSARGPVAMLLDPAFGFFIWAAHLLAIYVATATACQLGLGASTGRARWTFVAVLVVITLAALTSVAVHARRRYRVHRPVAQRHLRMVVTVGSDAIAGVAIAWQLLAILLVPLCA